MTNLGNRIQKIENALAGIPGGSKKVKAFFRENPDDRRPERWIEQGPRF